MNQTNEAIPTSSVDVTGVKDENEEPESKKRKDLSDKLEHRLAGILCCSVCQELPPAAVYQCVNGHLMCAMCFMHLLAEARLRDESAACPKCRIEVSKTAAPRNLAVEKTVSELPSECRFCAGVFPRNFLRSHEERLCDDRLTSCRFACIGCNWRGPAHEAAAHQADCVHPRKSAAEVVDMIGVKDKREREALGVFEHLMDLLSYEKLTFIDLQLKPYRTEEYVNKLYYESSRFTAFAHQWVVKAFINKTEKGCRHNSQREITYQLILKSKSICSLPVQWVCLRGPQGDAAMAARIESHIFHDDAPDSVPLPLSLRYPEDANRLLSNKAIHFRVVMFLVSK